MITALCDCEVAPLHVHTKSTDMGRAVMTDDQLHEWRRATREVTPAERFAWLSHEEWTRGRIWFGGVV